MIWLQFVYCVAVIVHSGGDAYTKSPWFPVRVTLGRVGEISAEEARDAAMAAWLQMKQGVNPKEQNARNRVRGMTLREAFRLFMSSEPRSPKTIQLYQATFDRSLSLTGKVEQWKISGTIAPESANCMRPRLPQPVPL